MKHDYFSAVEGTSQPATTTLSTVFFPPEMSPFPSSDVDSSPKTSDTKCAGLLGETANAVIPRREKKKQPESWDSPQGDGQVRCGEGNEKAFPQNWNNAGYKPSRKYIKLSWIKRVVKLAKHHQGNAWKSAA
ncbi:hypothetical protein IFR04_013425 [Cadophora malorum]|uniref:Uncharacterized protein n=1 Tax=Cadophora malorum TaxID=108018 RepID=A0A8H7T738_9HELO|nr:hypothetical protein IFR04_013425 [Cadophora malorum]